MHKLKRFKAKKKGKTKIIIKKLDTLSKLIFLNG